IKATHYLPASPIAPEGVWANMKRLLVQPQAWGRISRLALGDAGCPGLSRRLRLLLQIWRGALLADRIHYIGCCSRIHSQFADGAATTALVASRLLNLPFSFTSHTSFDSPLLTEKLKAASFVASISEFDRLKLLNSVVGQEYYDRVKVVRCG